MYCGNCGKEISYNSTFRPECGAKTGIVENAGVKIDEIEDKDDADGDAEFVEDMQGEHKGDE